MATIRATESAHTHDTGRRGLHLAATRLWVYEVRNVSRRLVNPAPAPINCVQDEAVAVHPPRGRRLPVEPCQMGREESTGRVSGQHCLVKLSLGNAQSKDEERARTVDIARLQRGCVRGGVRGLDPTRGEDGGRGGDESFPARQRDDDDWQAQGQGTSAGASAGG